MDEAARVAFVFGGTVDPDEWVSAKPDDRSALIEERFGAMHSAQLMLRFAVVDQLITDKPPQVWSTARRLADGGIAADAVINQLAMVFAQTMAESLERDRLDEAAYVARLDRLPLPGPDEIEREMLDVAATRVVLPTDELVAATADRLGVDIEDPVILHIVERVEEQLADDFGPLAWLHGDRTAHIDALCNGIVLTHVLSDVERSIGALSVSFDLAGFGRHEELTFDGQPIEAVSVERGHVSWMGPEGWLNRFDVDAVLAVRVDGDGTITIETLTEAPPVDDDLVAAARRVYDAESDDAQLPVSGEELVFGLLAEERATFAAARAPLDAVCEAAGLDRQASAVAHDPALWRNQRMLHRMRRVSVEAEGDTALAQQVLDIIELLDELDQGEVVDDARIGRALDDLTDLDVLDLVTDEVFGESELLADAESVAARLVDVAAGSVQHATARLLAARGAEFAGDWPAAEQHLELAVEADPSNVPATDRLAWYASDRGDAARAVQLWRRCPYSLVIAQDLGTVEPFTRPSPSNLGRNDRCWCGSGRKYKQCHLGVPAPAALPDRVGWLCRKAVGYLERIGPQARDAVLDVADARAIDGDGRRVLDDPLVLDLVLTELGWFRRFLADRGDLLPDDEALLAASWTTIERTVYEITSTTPGVGLTARDLRTGDVLDVRERTFSRDARVGMLLCARAVPDGETHQLVGGAFAVAVGTEAALLDLLDEGDPYEIASWVGNRGRTPEIRTRENELVVECEIVVTADDIDMLVAHLDGTYENDTPGEWWTEHHDLDELEGVVRARFHLQRGRLTITTNSNQRADRILDRLDAVPHTIVYDERTPVDADSILRSKRQGLPDLRTLGGSMPEVGDDAITEIQEQMEARWCRESVPALGGLTPRQAAADPTRREQLERLLDSFDAMPTPSGAFTMRTDRLRALLGL